jgi:hypothetical protein
MREIFVREFAASSALPQVFLELLARKASLTRSTTGRSLESGNEIRVSRPARRSRPSPAQRGEKELRRHCALFRDHEVRPTPFCVMDGSTRR